MGAGVAARGRLPGLDGPPAGRPLRPRRAVLPLEPGRAGRGLPDRHDLCRLSGPATAGVRGLAREDHLPCLRPAAAAARREARRHDRLRDDREAGRLRPARDRDRGALPRRYTAEGRLVPAERPQVVLLRAAVSDGFFTLARAAGSRSAAGVTCFFVPRLPARRQPQPAAPAAAQGQVRQPLQRVQRGRVSRHPGRSGRRGGPRHPRDPLARAPDPARLRRRLGRADAPGPDAGARTTPAAARASGCRWPTSR